MSVLQKKETGCFFFVRVIRGLYPKYQTKKIILKSLKGCSKSYIRGVSGDYFVLAQTAKLVKSQTACQEIICTTTGNKIILQYST